MATRRPGHAGRGGPRTATPGTNYTNRTDLQARQPIATAPGQAYGVAGQQAAAQSAMPLPGGGASAGPTLGGPASPGPAGPLPGSLGPLHAPTNRPAEPLTHGLPTGPGGGPEVLGNAPDPTLNMLRGIYARYPNPDLAALLNEAYARAQTTGGTP